MAEKSFGELSHLSYIDLPGKKSWEGPNNR